VRVFVAGATGVIGIRLVPLLVAAGHDVAGMTRFRERTDVVRSLGAKPVAVDVYDVEALHDAIVSYAPNAVVHQLTDLPEERRQARDFEAANARIRRE
jgi:nucleoside-diphosphate-sugar epimerase